MMKVEEVEFNENGQVIAMKGTANNRKFDLPRTFEDYGFSRTALKVMFWSQFEIDYCGG